MGTWDVNVDVNVSTEGALAGEATFTVPLFVGIQGAGFTERVRKYNLNSEVANDSDVGAPSVAQAAADTSASTVD